VRFQSMTVLTVASIMATACAAESPHSIDLTAEVAAVNETSLKWLEFAAAKDAAGVASLFTSDGVLFSENEEPVVGPAAIEALVAQRFEENPDQVPAFGSDRIEVAASGDLAVEFGTWGPEGPDGDYGKYITVYRKVDGVWKVAGDMSLSTRPESEAAGS
jgi:ketosteroid isomerase-like protein